MTKEVLRKCKKYLCESQKFTTLLEAETLHKINNALRLLHCSAYNCLVTLFIRTQTEPKLYFAFLFKEDGTKNEYIFEHIVDKDRRYKFQIETESFQDKKTRFISLRNEFREINTNTSGNINYINSLQTMSDQQQQQQVAYIDTQNMYQSSLSEELSVYDFTGQSAAKTSLSMLNTQCGFGSSGDNSLLYQFQLRKKLSNVMYFKSDTSLASMDEKFSHDANIEIEIDDLNQNESMCSFVELIQSLVANKITPVYDKDHTPSDMPPWMTFLHKKISDIYTNENVKLFIIRAIINVQHVFKMYAKFWYAPLIGFLVNSSLTREDDMDYFTLDLMVLLLSWHTIALPQPKSEKKLINRLFENLIKRCYHENRSILKNNLELLKTMTECWRECIDVPVSIINSFLIAGEQKKCATGIQLFGVVLSNEIETYDYPSDVNCIDFYKNLIKCMKDSTKAIHASSAEVVGMLLKKLAEKNQDPEIFNQVVGFLFEVLRDLDISLFITCVHRVQLNYPPISERCTTKLVFNLPKLYGEFKLMCAESILSSIKCIEDPLFKTSSFMDMLTHRESSLQLVCLKMIYELLSKQSDEEIQRLLPIICSFINHPFVACRYQMILIMINLFGMYQFRSEKNVTEIKIMVNETLLKALLDEDQTIRLVAQNFWTEKANMPSSTIDRMVLILEKMYSPSTEIEYLSYSTNLLLEKTSKSPDYNRLIYENPLSQCTFREYNLNVDWRRRHEMMTPLFVETINSLSSNESQSDMNIEQQKQMVLASQSQSNNANFYLRATQQQSLQFQPTQAYNWLTQQSIDTLQSSLMYSGSLGETQSALLFNIGPKTNKLGNYKIDHSSDLMSNSDREILKLRKRFIKDKTVTQNRFFARKQVSLNLKIKIVVAFRYN